MTLPLGFRYCRDRADAGSALMMQSRGKVDGKSFD
jgi:hypothetical protein